MAYYLAEISVRLMNTTYLYVLIYTNKLVIKDVVSNREVTALPETSFTTSRIIIGDMLSAMKTLKKGEARLSGERNFLQKLLPRRFKVIIHPMEMTEGGLCSTERHFFRDFGHMLSPSPSSSGLVTVYVCDHPEILENSLVKDILTGRKDVFNEKKE
ncbi:hypothetical protein CHI95_21840 [Providencia rettgeri]|uniref:Uncharacterized protein n=1 Tax=Providencia rettgeri TaxID=587 RepID=A0A264VNI8_PRORE|nr:hypothetical protein [Providencia rettgeri]OZS72427.1 hypothetical protein CHI95_21840 [Providencia rettgeri]